MCFSATASFTASGVLALLGGITLAKVRNKRLLPLALFPWFFSLQQAMEGFLWLDIGNPYLLKNFYLFFAFFFWPFWIPFSLWAAETHSKQKKILFFFTCTGLITGILWGILIPSTTFNIQYCGIHYILPNIDSAYLNTMKAIYTICALGSPFISSLKSAKVLALILVVTTAIAAWIQWNFFISIWCFFMAISSILILWILQYEKQ